MSNPKLKGVHNVISKLISIDDKYALSLEVALGGAKDYVVVDNSKVAKDSINYLKENIEVEESDKKSLLGIIGNFKEEELRELIFEVLTPIGYNLMVTPKEIDFIIEILSDIISSGINNALHENVDNL